MQCSNCGTECLDNANFCKQCGSAFGKQEGDTDLGTMRKRAEQRQYIWQRVSSSLNMGVRLEARERAAQLADSYRQILDYINICQNNAEINNSVLYGR